MKMSELSQATLWPEMELPSMSSPADFRAKPSAVRLVEETTRPIYGRRWAEWSVRSAPVLQFAKTSNAHPSHARQIFSANWGCAVTLSVFLRMRSGQTIQEIAGGLLHTPTRTANFRAPSMQKWPSCRRYAAIFGARRITGPQFAFLMGYPATWAILDYSETPCCQSSPNS